MKSSYTSLFALSVAATFCLQGCTSSVSVEPIDKGDSDTPTLSFENMPLSTQELIINGMLIEGYYVNAAKELRDIDYYLQEGERHGFSSEDYVFPDVSYMYASLSDNYTRYFDPSYAELIMKYLTYSESAVGIGAEVRETSIPKCSSEEECTDSTTVLVFNRVYANAPAEKAGIKVGDTLQSIDGTIPATNIAFQKLAAGEVGEKTTIVVKRGEESLSFEVTFKEYLSPTVFLEEIDSIPIITVTEYTDTTTMVTGTYGEFVEALKQSEEAKATIIDLRGNPGGTVEMCIQMAAELLSKNDTIITIVQHGFDENEEDPMPIIDTLTWTVDEDGIAKDRYFVFLADSGSASCAEIMLAGVVSNTKSPIVGQITYGKGIGQSYMSTYAGGIAGITSMRLWDKNGKTYHKYGIVPDFEESDPNKALKKAIELAKERTEKRTQEYGTVDLGHFTLAKSHASSKTPERGGAYRVIRDPLKLLPKPAPLK